MIGPSTVAIVLSLSFLASIAVPKEKKLVDSPDASIQHDMRRERAFVLSPKNMETSVNIDLSAVERCSTSFCGHHHGSCCPNYYCVGLGASSGRCVQCSTSFCGGGIHGPCCDNYYCVGLGASPGRCVTCSTSFCGGGNYGPCCDGYYCVGLGATSGRCMRCSTSFCGGGNHGPCCSGYSCVGLGVGPGRCTR